MVEHQEEERRNLRALVLYGDPAGNLHDRGPEDPVYPAPE